MKSKLIYIITTFFLLVGFINIQAQESRVPIDVQLEILTKVLTMDKSINHSDPEEVINLGILYSNDQRSSVTIKNEITELASNNELTVHLAKIVITPIDVSNIKNLERHFIDQNISVLYFTPIRGYDISMISKLCKENNIITFTGVSSFVDNNNISVGFELDNNKLQITIDLESAKAEGANFSSRLLNVSKVK